MIEKNNYTGIKVLIVGDIMLDRYWWGSVDRISPEAPVPVVSLESVSEILGGAANVAANVAGLGATPVLVGILGDDKEAQTVSDLLSSKNIDTDFIVKFDNRRTTVKTRIVAHQQQIVRVDQESTHNLSDLETEQIWEILKDLIKTVDIVVVSDYAKGVVSDNLVAKLIECCRQDSRLVLIDPKGKDFSKYRNGTMLTPNRFELSEVSPDKNYSQDSVEINGHKLLSELNLEYLLVTQGEDGMTLFEKDKKPLHLLVELRNVYDVTGAGDTVIACLAVCMAAGDNFTDASALANKAAGLVIENLGTTAITLSMLNHNINGQTFENNIR